MFITARQIQSALQTRQQFLEDLIRQKTRSLQNVPEGRLRGISRQKGYQYYWRKKKTDRGGTYIKSGETAFIKKLGQKEYDRRVLISSETESRLIAKLLLYYLNEKNVPSEEVFDQMSPWLAAVCTPCREPIDQFIEHWQDQEYPEKPGYPKSENYISQKNEKMRSKSELLIANALARHNIPYHYEKPLCMKNVTFYPDFTTLECRTRKEIIWEHFGMMDNPEYLEEALAKLITYAKNGYYPGSGLIITFETSQHPLNMQMVEGLIKKFYL